MSEVAEKTQRGFSYELGVDLNHGTRETPDWRPMRFCKAIAPQATPKEIDGQTYDDLGADHPVKVGESWGLSVTQQQHRLANGMYLPETELIMAAAAPDATGSEATVHLRVYDKPAEGAPNPTDAFEGFATVSVTRAQTGTAEEGGWNFEFKGQGPRKRIPNPLAESGKPVVTSVSPQRATVGKQVTISGAGLKSATKVEFGSTNAEFTVVGDTLITVVPSGASGSVKIKVTNPRGAGDLFSYTVG